MKRLLWMLTLLVFGLCTFAQAQQSPLEARRGHKTKLTKKARDSDRLEQPPPRLFSLIKYSSPAGKMAAYLGKPPKSGGGKYPAIIWVTGGFPPGGIGSSAWDARGRSNDQSAKAYRQAGMVMMYPTFRGSSGNPGVQEGLYGEVDDVLAALEYLRRVDYVDPARIYLGGHSTGGTLVLLVAACTSRFRAVFAFGPVARVVDYGVKSLPFDPNDAAEGRLRAPVRYLGAIRSPTYVIEGTRDGNLDSLQELRRVSTNKALVFAPIRGADHFNLLAPLNELIASKIGSLGADTPLSLSARELQRAYDREQTLAREATDLHSIARARRAGVSLKTPRVTRHYLYSRKRTGLAGIRKDLERRGFSLRGIEERKDRQGKTFYLLVATKRLTLSQLEEVFAASKTVSVHAARLKLDYGGWDVE